MRDPNRVYPNPEGILCETYALVGAAEVLWTSEASDGSDGASVGIGGAGTGASRAGVRPLTIGSRALGEGVGLLARGEGGGGGGQRRKSGSGRWRGELGFGILGLGTRNGRNFKFYSAPVQQVCGDTDCPLE
jgi:hypothetical protein